MEKMQEFNIKDEYKKLNKLIKNNKVKFSFYNSYFDLKLLEFCYNKADDTIELKFRDIMTERISELKELLAKKECK